MKLTEEWLKENGACSAGFDWWKTQNETNAVDVLRELTKQGKLDWANWLIVRVMTKPQYVAYAIYAAEQVIEIYEKKYPDDKRPRQAIEAAKEVLKNDTAASRTAADAAYAASRTAADAAYAAYAAADAAARTAAYAAACTAMKRKIIEYGIKLLLEK